MDRRAYRRRPHLIDALERPGGARLALLLHGYQDEPASMLAVADTLDPDGELSFFVPRGPVETVDGPAWFVDEHGASVRQTPPAGQTLMGSIDRLDALITREASRVGVDPADTVLAGYSQGAAVALALALRSGAPRRLRGVAAIAGYLPHADGLEWAFADAAATTEVLLVHGTHDPAVPVQQGRSAARVLERHGVSTRFVETDADHGLGRRLIEPVAEWLKELLCRRATGQAN